MISSSFPILVTDRVTLRQLHSDDDAAIFALRSDPKINEYLDRQPCNNIEDAIHFIHKVNENIKNNNSLYWAIELTDSKVLIGTICIFGFSEENSSCEIGYELTPSFQGQGLMKEAAEAVIHYVFTTLQLKNIHAVTHYGNEKSAQVLTRLNFIKTEERDPECPDLEIYRLTQND